MKLNLYVNMEIFEWLKVIFHTDINSYEKFNFFAYEEEIY